MPPQIGPQSKTNKETPESAKRRAKSAARAKLSELKVEFFSLRLYLAAVFVLIGVLVCATGYPKAAGYAFWIGIGLVFLNFI
jgi:hypothetical protein